MTRSFAERAVEEFAEKMKAHAKSNGLVNSTSNDPQFLWSLGFFESSEIAQSFFLTKIAEAEQRGRDMAVDYIESVWDRGHDLFCMRQHESINDFAADARVLQTIKSGFGTARQHKEG